MIHNRTDNLHQQRQSIADRRPSSLAKSGLEILHIDQRPQYGGAEASLSLVEAETWADQHGSGMFRTI